jgi:flagellar hook-associated protein 3 FlgL
MRISTNELYRQGVGSMQDRQAELARVQQQLATGQRLLAPSDDPTAAVQALGLEQGLAQLDQYGRNAGAVAERLGQTEAALDRMGQILVRARELTVQAANATQTNESRGAIASELRELTDGLISATNTRDARGEYLFAGNRTGSMPFVRNAAGAVEYQGDNGQRRLAIAADRTLVMTESGAPLMAVPQGNGVFVTEPVDGNQGTARIVEQTVIDPRAAAGSFEIRFGTSDGYLVLDAAGEEVASGTFAAGAALEFAGRRIVLDGAPAAGDRFMVRPAGAASAFAALDELAARLATPVQGPADRVRLDHDLDRALQDLDQVQNRIAEIRTSVGARLSAVDSQVALNEDRALRMQSKLSGIRDLDYAEAIGEFQLNQVALQAAQQAYVQMSRLSLFDYLR